MSVPIEEPDEVAKDFVIPPRPPAPLGITSVNLVDSEGDVTMLSAKNGDVIATALSGPNAGKTVNLTYGKWA